MPSSEEKNFPPTIYCATTIYRIIEAVLAVGVVLTMRFISKWFWRPSNEPALDGQLIWHRFYRPSEKVKGNGLGLTIVKAICEYHGWTVSYWYQDVFQ